MTVEIKTLNPPDLKFIYNFRRRWFSLTTATDPKAKITSQQCFDIVSRIYRENSLDPPIQLLFDSPVSMYREIKEQYSSMNFNLTERFVSHAKEQANHRFAQIQINPEIRLDGPFAEINKDLERDTWAHQRTGETIWILAWKNNDFTNLPYRYIPTLKGNTAIGEFMWWELLWQWNYEFSHPHDAVKDLIELGKICSGVCFFRDVCFISRLPVEFHTKGKSLFSSPHCQNGPAVRYRDGNELYAVDGKIVDQFSTIIKTVCPSCLGENITKSSQSIIACRCGTSFVQ